MKKLIGILVLCLCLVLTAQSASAVLDSGAHSVPILLYHGIVNGSTTTEVTYTAFLAQMTELKKQGYTTISYDEYERFLAGNYLPPKKSILLTFDDGRKDTFTLADPVLRQNGFEAVMFLLPKYSAKEKVTYYLNKSQVDQMLATGRWNVQAHGYDAHSKYAITNSGTENYFLPNKLWLVDKNRLETDQEYEIRLEKEFSQAKDAIEKNWSIQVTGFAFPFGQYGQKSANYPRAAEVVRDLASDEYDTVFYQTYDGEGFTYNFAEENDFMSKRIIVEPKWSTDQVLKRLNNGEEKSVPFFDDYRTNKGWYAISGDPADPYGELTLRSRTATTTSAYLDGTKLWKNYRYDAKVYSLKGKTFSVMANFQDKSNFVSCDFSGNYVWTYLKKDGNSVKLKERRIATGALPGTGFYGIQVNGDQVSCILNKTIVSTATLPSGAAMDGGIGLKMYDPAKDAILIVDYYNVTSVNGDILGLI